jgi:hypothetical protein
MIEYFIAAAFLSKKLVTVQVVTPLVALEARMSMALYVYSTHMKQNYDNCFWQTALTSKLPPVISISSIF